MDNAGQIAEPAAALVPRASCKRRRCQPLKNHHHHRTTHTKESSSFSALTMMLFVVALWMMCSMPSACHAFTARPPPQMSMEYKPPLKSSLRKFQDTRFSSREAATQQGTRRSTISHTPDSRTKRRSSSKASAAMAGTASAYAPSTPSTFEQRMRDALFGGVREKRRQHVQRRKAKGAASAAATTTTTLPPNVVTIESLQDFKRVVGDESERMVAVRFHATYCRACKAVSPAFYQLARTHPGVIFVDVPVTSQTAVLHQGLGVPSLPFGHLYHPTAGLVEETKLLRRNIPKFRDTLRHYLQGSCPIPEEEEEDAEGRALDD